MADELSPIVVEMIGDMINGVDTNSKREADKLSNDITLLRGELNDTRSDIMLMRSEMNTLRVDMSDMRGKLEREMITCDKDQTLEIELIKQEGKITGDRKAKFWSAVVAIVGIVATIIAKILGVL